MDNFKILDEILEKVKEMFDPSDLGNLNKDGRVASSRWEEVIIGYINIAMKEYDGLTLVDPASRNWYDFLIEGTYKGKEYFIPVNIKATEDGLKADNANCKKGIGYFVSGKSSKMANESSWDKYFHYISENRNKNEFADYYFMVIYKSDIKKSFNSSLRNITNPTINGNNPPFQVVWGKNNKRPMHNYDDTYEIIMGAFAASIIKSTSKYLALKKYVPELLEKYEKEML